MTALNFSVFLDQVKTRQKRRTIRKTARCKVGDNIQLYHGMRTKACAKLVEQDAVCTAIVPIEITRGKNREGRLKITWPEGIDKHLVFPGGLNACDVDSFARLDGFPDWPAMKQFFDETYGLPFKGFLHIWDWPNDNAKECHPCINCVNAGFKKIPELYVCECRPGARPVTFFAETKGTQSPK